MHTYAGRQIKAWATEEKQNKKLVLVYFIMDGMTELQNWTANQAHEAHKHFIFIALHGEQRKSTEREWYFLLFPHL